MCSLAAWSSPARIVEKLQRAWVPWKSLMVVRIVEKLQRAWVPWKSLTVVRIPKSCPGF